MQETETKKRFSIQELKSALKIYRYILPYKWYFIAGLIFLVLTTAITSFIPGAIGKLVDASNNSKELISQISAEIRSSHSAEEQLRAISIYVQSYHQNIDPEKLKDIGVLLAVILLVTAVFSFFRVYLFEYVAQHAMLKIRQELYNKIISLPIRFYEENRTGNLISRITADVSQLQDALTSQLAFFVRQLVLPIVCMPLAFFVSIKLSLIIMALLPVIIVSAVIFGRFIRKNAKEVQAQLADTAVMIEETFQSADVVKSFTNERYESNRYLKLITKVKDVAMHAAIYRAAFIAFIIFVMFGAIIFIVSAGLNEVRLHHIEMGDLIKFFLLTIFIGSSLAGLSESFSVVAKTIGASERLSEILDEKAEIDLADADLLAVVAGNIQFKNVQFNYPSREDVTIFSELNFSVRTGEKIALVGPSGSGKSTIIKILSGFYPIQGGEIIIDEKFIDDYNLTAYRKNLGIVPQDVILFGGSIAENISYGKVNATEKEIYEAAKKANALDFIEAFPEKFQTIVGERGMKLSGGQKQRIAIARAILRDPKILILDEATSSLDSESEKLVKDALDKLMQGRTTFIIAHRLSTIREADRILVISKGKIVEQGTHEDLMKLENGLYANLLKIQYELE